MLAEVLHVINFVQFPIPAKMLIKGIKTREKQINAYSKLPTMNI